MICIDYFLMLNSDGERKNEIAIVEGHVENYSMCEMTSLDYRLYS